jgi:hypothetical protein
VAPPFAVAISDLRLRAAVEEALVARAQVHAISTAAPTVLIETNSLPYAHAAEFRVMRNGTLGIALDPNQSATPCLDVLHEVGHYVDWALLPPPSVMSTAAQPPELTNWFAAVSASSAIREMHRIRTNPTTVSVTLGDGTIVQLVEDAAIAEYALDAWEVFARSYCQWIALRSGNARLRAELVRALQNHYPEQWRPDDFEPIARATDDLLGGATP